jgi:hypothetical protein
MTESAGLLIENSFLSEQSWQCRKSIVSLAAHRVEQSKERSQYRDEVPVREINNRAMIGQVGPEPDFLAQHRSKRNSELRPFWRFGRQPQHKLPDS